MRSWRHCLICKLSGVLLASLTTSTIPHAQASGPNADESWTATSENTTEYTNPYRTTESHSQSGNRTIDKKTVEVRGPGGAYELHYRTETETIQESPTLTRSVTRTYNLSGDRNEHLTQIVEIQTNGSDNGSRTVKTISDANLDGKFEVKAREISVTEKTSDLEKTQTIVYLPSTASQFAPTEQIIEQQRHREDGSIETKREISFPDFSGGWQAYEVHEQTVRGDSKERTTDERISRRDAFGNVSPVAEVIAKETNSNDRHTSTTQTYSIDVPGSTRDEHLHLLQSSTVVEIKEAGRTVTQTQLLQPDSVKKGSSTVINSVDLAVEKGSSTQETITVTARYPDGNPSVVSVETRKTEAHQ